MTTLTAFSTKSFDFNYLSKKYSLYFRTYVKICLFYKFVFKL